MFTYYLRLAVFNVRRNPYLTLLMVAAIGIGIAASMTLLTLRYQMMKDPIPHKSARLYAVQIDNRSPEDEATRSPEDAPRQLAYRDAEYLTGAESPAKYQAAMMRTGLVAETDHADIPPTEVSVRATYSDFFAMFEPPFLYGRPWSQQDDVQEKQVVVLSDKINQTLFGGRNSVGERLLLSGQYYEVIGVLKPWNLVIKFYQIEGADPFSGPEQAYIPFTLAVKYQMPRNGNTNCWEPRETSGYQGFLNSECVWIQMWVELENKQQAQAYLEFLNHYVEEQQRYGRLQRPLNNFISPVLEWMRINEIVPEQVNQLLVVAFAFLAVCLLNTVGLLLAKFIGKARDISIRRALGASRKALFMQYLAEVGVIGLLGGVLGVLLTQLSLRYLSVEVMRINKEDSSLQLLHTDWQMLLVTLLVALVAGLIAGLYPAWRVSHLPPAQYLKTQ